MSYQAWKDADWYKQQRETIGKLKRLSHTPILTTIQLMELFHLRVQGIQYQKNQVLREGNAVVYDQLSQKLKARYKILNKERKAIQDTFDRVGALLKAQEEACNRGYTLGLCEEL